MREGGEIRIGERAGEEWVRCSGARVGISLGGRWIIKRLIGEEMRYIFSSVFPSGRGETTVPRIAWSLVY